MTKRVNSEENFTVKSRESPKTDEEKLEILARKAYRHALRQHLKRPTNKIIDGDVQGFLLL